MNRGWGICVEAIYEENQHISNAGYELLNNLVNSDKILNEINDKPDMQEYLVKVFWMANAYLLASLKEDGDVAIRRLTHENYCYRFPVCLNF